MHTVVIVLTTLPADAEVSSFARMLVDERLAACVNVLAPLQSVYRWEGKVEEASERQLVIKTTAARVEELKARFSTLHPYEVPEMLVLPVAGGGQRYLDWVAESA
jgi:periplasmic divalent cation tolerance protein